MCRPELDGSHGVDVKGRRVYLACLEGECVQVRSVYMGVDMNRCVQVSMCH